jgi:hypothetical protein
VFHLAKIKLEDLKKHFNQGFFYKDEELFLKILDVFVKTP